MRESGQHKARAIAKAEPRLNVQSLKVFGFAGRGRDRGFFASVQRIDRAGLAHVGVSNHPDDQIPAGVGCRGATPWRRGGYRTVNLRSTALIGLSITATICLWRDAAQRRLILGRLAGIPEKLIRSYPSLRKLLGSCITYQHSEFRY